MLKNKFWIFFEDFILKKRYLIDFPLMEFKLDRDIINCSLSEIPEEFYCFQISKRLDELIELRKQSDSWILFAFHENEIVLGYSFLHIPHTTEWNDSLPTLPGEARFGSIFVEPAVRGQGIMGRLYKAKQTYCYRNNIKMWGVIEERNRSSIKAAHKNGGQIERINYLVKLSGRNVFSVVFQPLKVYFLWGNRRARR